MCNVAVRRTQTTIPLTDNGHYWVPLVKQDKVYVKFSLSLSLPLSLSLSLSLPFSFSLSLSRLSFLAVLGCKCNDVMVMTVSMLWCEVVVGVWIMLNVGVNNVMHWINHHLVTRWLMQIGLLSYTRCCPANFIKVWEGILSTAVSMSICT